MKMIDKNGNTDAAHMKGILGGPIMLAAALFVFLIAAQVSGLNGWTDEIGLLALPAVAALGVAREISSNTLCEQLNSAIAPSAFVPSPYNILFAPAATMTFLLATLSTHLLVSRGRPVEANFLVGGLIGIQFAMIFALTSEVPDDSQTNATRAY